MNITTLIDKDDPIKRIIDIVKIDYSDGRSEFSISFQPDFLIDFLKSDAIISLKNPTSDKISEILFNELEAYQEKHKSHLPPITVEEIRQTFKKNKKALDELSASFKKLAELYEHHKKMWKDILSWIKATEKEHPDHFILFFALKAAREGNKQEFVDFIKRDVKLPGKYRQRNALAPITAEDYMGYVWEIIERMIRVDRMTLPEYFSKYEYPPGYIQTVAFRLTRDTSYKKEEKLKPAIWVIKKFLNAELNKNLDGNDLNRPYELLIEIFPLANTIVGVSYDSLQDLEEFKTILALEQAVQKIAKIKPERLKEMLQLLRVRLDGYRRKEVGKILGWSDKRVQRVWRYTTLKMGYLKKIYNS
jgi:hypothetical protein